jgi:hypothetical protein
MAEPKGPDHSSDMEPAEGSRDTVDANVDDRDADRRYEDAEPANDQRGGITNRPIAEELENQRELPARGGAKPGSHAS